MNRPTRRHRPLKPRKKDPTRTIRTHAHPSSRLKPKAGKKSLSRARIGLLKNKSKGEALNDVEKKMLDHEMAIAQELQANLLPRRIPKLPGYELNAYYRPSQEVGGDYYDFIPIDENHIAILVADVAGKGIPGSIVMTETRALFKSEAKRSLSPQETLLRVNRTLHEDIKRGMFVTVFYMILNIPRMVLQITSAGHNPMVLWRQKTKTCHLVNTNGLALGIDRGSLFEKTLEEKRLQLRKGDRFVLYTDGVVEAMNSNSDIYGDERFHRQTAKTANLTSSEYISLLVKDLESFQSEAPQSDDITIVTGRCLPDSMENDETFLEEA